MMKYIKGLVLLFVLITNDILISQVFSPFQFNSTLIPCKEVTPMSAIVNSQFIGYSKPERTDYLQASFDAYFPVMIIFVQYANDPGPEASYWTRGGDPDFMNTIISPIKKYPAGNNWWDTYSESADYISDFWMEQSRGHLHVVGSAYSITLDHNYEYYETNGGHGKVNDDIYQKLNSQYSIDWRAYDKWKMIYTLEGHSFDDASDGLVDMIYKVFRSHAPIPGMPDGGMAMLGESYSQGINYLVDSVNNIYVCGGFGSEGSGITLTPGYGGTIGSGNYAPNPPLTRRGMSSFSEHEHGHYLYGGGHGNYGKMMSSFGLDESLSPWESVSLGYMKTRRVNYDIIDYDLGDFSSRTADEIGEVLEIPIIDASEFFLVANRTKVSFYDRIMWGDTAHDDPYRNINPDYGKGVYIYHTPSGYTYPPLMDQECADGLYNWVLSGYEHPDWSNEQLIPYYVKESVSYLNDRSLGRISDADGKSIFSWFGIGAKHPCLGCDGTDRVYSNFSEVWTSREGKGDRWDAWNFGYNEIFSPYSSPSTRDWNNSQSGIFVWLTGSNQQNHDVEFKIFKAGEGGFSEEEILKLTPPSRPMGLNVSLTGCDNNVQYPQLTWLKNMEPDMTTPQVPVFPGISYKIYLAKSSGDQIPEYYELEAAVGIDTSQIQTFVDYQHPVQCSGLPANLNLRYVITAVDGYGWESVRSDFASFTIGSQSATFNFSVNNANPKSYRLYQNYPNPFNPLTVIKYDLPSAAHVRLKVFNLLGEEIALLVDGNKPAGSHSTVFDGQNLPSGVYIYRLESTAFSATRKMVLIK